MEATLDIAGAFEVLTLAEGEISEWDKHRGSFPETPRRPEVIFNEDIQEVILVPVAKNYSGQPVAVRLGNDPDVARRILNAFFIGHMDGFENAGGLR